MNTNYYSFLTKARYALASSLLSFIYLSITSIKSMITEVFTLPDLIWILAYLAIWLILLPILPISIPIKQPPFLFEGRLKEIYLQIGNTRKLSRQLGTLQSFNVTIQIAPNLGHGFINSPCNVQCQLLHSKDFYAGNVKDSSIIEIYNNSNILEKCRHLTVDNIKGCSTCFLRYVCGGACRARAYHECGKVDVSGNFCEYEKKAFVDGIFEIYSENLLYGNKN